MFRIVSKRETKRSAMTAQRACWRQHKAIRVKDRKAEQRPAETRSSWLQAAEFRLDCGEGIEEEGQIPPQDQEKMKMKNNGNRGGEEDDKEDRA